MLTAATTTRAFKAVSSLVIMFSAAFILCGGSVQAANQVIWTGATSSDFEDGTNWQGGVVPADDAATDIAVFSSTPPTANQPTLTKNRSVAGLLFSTPQGGWTLAGNFTLTLGLSGLSSDGQTAGTNTISCGLNVSATQSWIVGVSGTISMTGVMTSAPGSVINYGDNTHTGLLAFTNHGNTGFLGGMTIYYGIVSASNGNNQFSPLGQGPYIINGASVGNGGTLRSEAADSFGYSGGGPSLITVNQGGLLTTGGSGNFRTTLGSTPSLIMNGGTVSDNGVNTGDFNGSVFSLQFGALNVVPDTVAGPSTISTKIGMQLIGTNTFNVGSGTPGGVDLDMSALTASLANYMNNGASSSFTKAGDGVMLLGGTSTFGGGTFLNAGTIRLASSTAFNVNNGGLTFGPNTTGVLQLNGNNATFPFLANDATTLGTPTIEAGAIGTNILTINNSSPSTFAGKLQDGLTGQLNLTKIGASTLSLTGSNLFTGQTVISAGTLYETMSSGEIRVNSGGTLSPGTPSTPGTLTAATPTARLVTNDVAGTATLSFRLNGPPGARGSQNDFIDLSTVSVSGSSAILNSKPGSTTIFNLSGGLGLNNGTYTLIQGNSVGTSVTGVPTLGTIPPGTNVVLTNTGNAITATVTLIPKTFVWSGLGADTNWTTAANWVGGIAPSGNNVETLIFASGASKFATNNDFANGTGFAAVSVIAGGYTLAGNNISLLSSATALNISTPSGTTNVSLSVGGGGAGITSNTPGGALTLSGLNTYTGPTTIVAGTLIISTLADGGQPSNIGASTNVASNLVLNSNTILLYTGPATSTDRLLTIASGNVTISASGTGALTFSNPGTIAFSGGSAAHTFTFTGTVADANTFTPIIPDSAAVTGISTIAKNGSGSWYFAGANTYTGTTTVNSGTFGISGGNDRLPTNNTVIFTGNSTFDLGANAQTVAGITLNDAGFTVTLNSAAGTPLTTPLITFAGTASNNITILTGGFINFSPTGLTIDASGFPISSGSSAPQKTVASSLIGTGTLTINAFGDNTDTGGGTFQRLVLGGTNTFVGNINIIRGFLYWTTDAGLGDSNNGLILSSGTSGLLFPASTTIPATRTITLSGLGDRFIRGYSPSTETILGPIVGTGNLRITDGTQLVLDSTNNTYSGATIITNNVSISANADNTLSPNSQIQFFSNATPTLNLNNHNVTVASITGVANNGVINIGTGVLTAGGDNTSTTYGGVVNGAGTFNKQGTGSLTLSNGGSAFSGAVNVNSGVLIVDGAITGGGTTAIASGATLAGKGTVSGTITSSTGAVVAPGDLTGSTPQGTLNVGSLTLVPSSNLNIRLFGAATAGPAAGNDFINATGAVDLGGASLSVTGPSGFAAGTYRIINAGSVTGTLLPVSVPSGFKATVNVNANSVDLVIAAANTSFTWTGTASNLWTDGGNWVGGTAPSGNSGETLVFPDGVNSYTPQNDFPAGTGFTAITIASGATPYVITGNSVVLGSGATALTNSAGTNSINIDLTLNTATIAVSGGTLNVGQTSNVLNNNSSLISINNAGTLIINSVITGSGGLTQDTGTGVTTLNGANTFGGVTTIATGTIQLGSATALGSAGGNTTIAATGTLDLNGMTIAESFSAIAGTITNTGAAATITGAITNGLNFTVSGTGDITLNTVSGTATFVLTKSGANALTLTGTIDNTFLKLAATAGTTNLAKVPSSATVHAINAGSAVQSIAVTGTGIVKLGGTGGDQIADNNSVSVDTGATFDVNGVTETIDALNGLGTVDNSNVTTAGTLTFGSNNTNASFTGLFTNTASTLSLTKIGNGTEIIGNAGSSFTGTLTVNGGDLQVTVGNPVASPSTSTLGSVTTAHNVAVGGTGTLEFTVPSVLGLSTSTAPAITLVLNSGGQVLNTSGDTNLLGPITFNGGTLVTAATASATSQSYVLGGDITVTGTAVGSITRIQGTNSGVHLGANTTINVVDPNGNLAIGVPILNQVSSGTAGGITKTGPGTLSLFANSSFSGPTNVTTGTLAVSGILPGTDVTLASGTNLVVGGTLPVIGKYYSIVPKNTGGQNPDFFTLLALQKSLINLPPTVVNTVPTAINFGLDGSGFPPPFGVNVPNFEAVYTGFITIKTPGNYFFGSNSDDGTVFYVDGEIFSNNNGYHGTGNDVISGGPLTVGTHSVTIGFFQGTGGAGLVADISGPDFGAAQIPLLTSILMPKDATIGSLSGTGNVQVNLGSLTIGSSVNTTSTTYSGIISGTQNLTKDGSGSSLTLNSVNTYTGSTTVAAGTLKLGVANAIASGPGKGDVTVNGTLDVNGFSAMVNGLNGTGVIDSTAVAGGPFTFTVGGNNASGNFIGVIQNMTGSLTLNKIGTGSQTIEGINTFTGGTNITQGNVTAGGVLGTAVVTVSSGAALTTGGLGGLLGQYYDTAPNQLSVPIVNPPPPPAAQNYTIDPDFVDLPTLMASLVGKTPFLTAPSTGTFFDFPQLPNTGPQATPDYHAAFPGKYALNGANFEAIYTGRILIPTTGVYSFGTSSDDGSMLFIDGNTVVNNNYFQGVTFRSGSVSLTAGTHDIVVAFYEGGGGYGLDVQYQPGGSVGNTQLIPNSILNYGDLQIGSLAGAGSVIISGGPLTMGSDNTITSVFTGNISGAKGINKTGTGTQTLSGVDTYSGATVVQTGILKVGSSSAIPFGPTAGDVTVNGKLDLAGNNVTTNGLSGNGIVDNSAAGGPYTLTAGSNNTTSTFSGTVQNMTGTLALVKTGTGILTFNGIGTYGGATTITDGTLRIDAVPGSNSVAVANPSFETPHNDNFSGYFGVAGSSWTFNNYSGITGPNGGFGLSNTPDGTQVALIQTFNNSPSSISQDITFPSPGSYAVSLYSEPRPNLGPIPLTILIDGTPFGPPIVASTGFIKFTTPITIATAGVHTLTIQSDPTASDKTSFVDLVQIVKTSGSVSALPTTTVLSVSSTGTFDMNGYDATVSSLTGVAGGKILLATGSLTTGSDGTDTTFAGVISGTGSLTKVGAGSLTLSGADTFTGPTAVTAGSVTVASTTGSLVSPVNVTNGASLIVNGQVLALVTVSGSTASTPATTGSRLRGHGFVTAANVSDTLTNQNASIWPGISTMVSQIALNSTGNESLFAFGATIDLTQSTAHAKMVSLISRTQQTAQELFCGTLLLDSTSTLSMAIDSGKTSDSYTLVTADTADIMYPFGNYSAGNFAIGTDYDILYESDVASGSQVLAKNVTTGPLPANVRQIVITFKNTQVTPVKVDAFTAVPEGAGVKLAWNCVSEYQNAGFNVYRRGIDGGSWSKVNAALIAGRITNADAKTYSLQDWATAGIYEYKLESVSVRNEIEIYHEFAGPVVVDALSTPLAALDIDSMDAIATSVKQTVAIQNAEEAAAKFAALPETVELNRDQAGVAKQANLSFNKEGALLMSAAVRDFDGSKPITGTDSVAVTAPVVNTPAVPSALNVMASSRWFTTGTTGTASTFTGAKVVYDQPGVLLISQASIPAGIDLNQVAVQREGRSVPILAHTAAGLVVFGQGYEDDYTNKDALFLRPSTAPTVAGTAQQISGLFDSAQAVNTNSPATVTVDYHDVYFDYNTAFRPYTFSPWFSGQYLTATDVASTTQTFSVSTPNASSGAATMTVNVWSLTSSGGNGIDHAVLVTVNGKAAGQATWNGGNKMVQLTFQVPSGALQAGANQIGLSTPALSGVASQIAFLHSISVSYTSALDGSDPISVYNTGAATQLYEVSHVSSATTWVVDARYPDRAALVPYQAQAQNDGTYKIRFNAGVGGTGQFLVVASGRENAPVSVTKRAVKPVNTTPYIAVGPAQFGTSVQPLLAARSKDGLRAQFVDQEQIFDFYNYGRYGPAGIQKAVQASLPQYLLLLGRTTYDYRNYSGLNVDPLCPAFLVSTTFWAQSTSDSMFGDLGRGYPEVAVGRLPANNSTELAAGVKRILGYTGAPVSGIRVQAVADQADPTVANFPAQAASMRSAFADLAWEPNYLGVTYNSAPEVTTALTTGANGGADWIVYIGHGNSTGLGASNPKILDTTSVQNWTGNVVLLQSTCNGNWMALDSNNFKSIAIQALGQSQGGICASIGTSTYMNSDTAVEFITQVMKNADSSGVRWGTALMKAQQWAAGQGSGFYADLNKTEQIFGDPAMPVFAGQKQNTATTTTTTGGQNTTGGGTTPAAGTF